MSAPKVVPVSANGHPCETCVVSLDSEKLNTAELKCFYPIRTEESIEVVVNKTKVFTGVIKECKKDSDKVMYKLYAEEMACKLMDIYYVKDGCPNIIIKAEENGTKRTIGYYLDKLPQIPIQSANDPTDYNGSTTVPQTEIPLPDVQYGRMTEYTAYKQILSDILGVPFWFELGNTRPTFGLCRNLTALTLPDDTILSSMLEEETYIPPFDSIVVIDDTRKIYGVAGQVGEKGVPTGEYQGVYQYDGEHTKEELDAMAAAILKLKGTKTERWRVNFGPGCALQFREGDIVQGIGDQTVDPPMIFKYGSIGQNIAGYQVSSVEITESGTTIYLGPVRRTVFDIYKERLRQVDGTGIPTETVTKESDVIKFTPT